MKVICIHAGRVDLSFNKLEPLGLVEGQCYTVIDEYINEQDYPCYLLAEITGPNPRGGFKKCRFIPLSNIDETEMKREYNHEPA